MMFFLPKVKKRIINTSILCDYIVKMKCPIHMGALETFTRSIISKYCRFAKFKMFISNIFHMFPCSRNARVTFVEKSQFWNINMDILWGKRNRCKSGVEISKLRIMWYQAYSPWKRNLDLVNSHQSENMLKFRKVCTFKIYPETIKLEIILQI